MESKPKLEMERLKPDETPQKIQEHIQKLLSQNPTAIIAIALTPVSDDEAAELPEGMTQENSERVNIINIGQGSVLQAMFVRALPDLIQNLHGQPLDPIGRAIAARINGLPPELVLHAAQRAAELAGLTPSDLPNRKTLSDNPTKDQVLGYLIGRAGGNKGSDDN